MQIVIEIDEEYYHFIKRQVAHGITNPLKTCIARGTQLPKGHGRLIDRDALIEKVPPEIQEYLDVLVPTIIEADKEE